MKPDYKVVISASTENTEWDAFVASAPGGHHVQSSGWARVKSILGWKVTRVSVKDRSGIIGGAQILIRPLPVVGSACYVTKGPLCHREDPDLAKTVLHEIIQIGRRNRCQFMAIQPPNNGEYLGELLESLNFRSGNLELAPTASVLIDLAEGPETIMARMKRETRHHIRHSEHAGIVVHEGDQSDLAIFYRLYLTTAKRQGFTPYQRKYFDMLWQTFAPLGWIVLLIACHEHEAVSAQLLIPFGDTVVAKMVGWSGGHSKRRPNDALYWASIQWAIQHGYTYFDFEGVDPLGAREILNGRKLSEIPGLSQDIIKYGYGGKVVLYPPVYDYLPNKMFDWVYRRMTQKIGSNSLTYRFVEHLRKR